MPRTSRRLVEGRIEELRLILGSARVIEDGEVLTDMVGVGSIVRVKDLEKLRRLGMDHCRHFRANPAEDRISNESPVGQALMGKKVGRSRLSKSPRG